MEKRTFAHPFRRTLVASHLSDTDSYRSVFALDRMLLLPLQARFGLLALAVGVCVWKIYNLWFSRLQPYDGLVWASRVEQIFPDLNSLLVNYVELVGPHQLRPVRRICIEWSRPKPSMLLSL